MKALAGGDDALRSAKPAFQKYNEEQLTSVKLPGGEREVGHYTSIKYAGLNRSGNS